MRKTVQVIVTVALLAVGGGTAAQGQDNTLPPTIVFFEHQLDPQPLSVVESGSVEFEVTWHVIHVNESHHLALEAYQGREWVSLAEPDETLPMVGSRGITLSHPANFGPPTYRLSIRDAGNRIVDERTLVVPYRRQQATPAIQAFTSDVRTVAPAALADGSARISVTWAVTGRQLTTNLRFRQVLTDGSLISVELPRSHYWVPSSETGTVVPVPPGGRGAPVVAGDMVQLRLEVVDVISGDIYDSRDISLDVLEPDAAQPPPESAEPTIVSFTATPETATSSGMVTLNWETLGAQRVWIEQYNVRRAGEGVPSNASSAVHSDQPINGSLVVTLTNDYLQGGAAVFVLVLNTYDADVRGPSAQVEVPISCTYTYFFEGGLGCPVGPPQNIEAVYQPFENGYVVVRGDSGSIYVHTAQGEATSYSANEVTFTNNPVTDEPPANLYTPQNTIGLVWGNFEGVRANLGWATGPEQSYTMQTQSVNSPPQMYTLYFTLPDGNVVGTGLSRWAIIQ